MKEFVNFNRKRTDSELLLLLLFIIIIIYYYYLLLLLPKFLSNNKLEINFRKTTIDLSL